MRDHHVDRCDCGDPRGEHRHEHARIDAKYTHVARRISIQTSTRAAPKATKRPTFAARTTLLALALFALWPRGVAHAAQPLRYAVDARVDLDASTVDLAMWVIVRIEPGEEEVRLWVYADRGAVAPAAMNDERWRWIYPGEVDLGGVVVREVLVGGAPVRARLVHAPAGTVRGWDVAGSDLVVPVGRAAHARELAIHVRARLTVPCRFGRIGRIGDQISLVGPWYPLVVGPGDAFRYEVPHHVRLEVPGASALLGETVVTSSGETIASTPYVPVVVAPELFVRHVRAARGMTLRFVSSREPYRTPEASVPNEAGLDDLVRVDTPRLIAPRLADVVATMREARVPLGSRSLTVVEVPSRTELAATAPGVVFVSDQLYEIFPIDATRDFHHRALRRAMFRHFIGLRTDASEHEADRNWTADLRAALLTDLDDARRRGRAQTPEELLELASWNPTVDQLLYAPQVRYAGVYFASAEADPFRDDPDVSRRPISRGRRILESARDVLGPRLFQRFATSLLDGHSTAREALARASPDAASRVRYWLDAPVLEVNYRLGAIRTRRVSGGYEHRIEIVREGADRPEPVEVVAEDEDGRVARGRWDAPGRRGVVVLRTRAPLEDVEIDPRGRLAQSAAIAEGHPRGDDATTNPWRPPLLNAFSLELSATEGQLEGLVDFALRRRYDLEQAVAMRLEHSVVATGGALRYVRGVGPKSDTNRRIAFFSVGVGFDRLRTSFGDTDVGGWGASLIGTAGADTRRYGYDPRHGAALVGAARLVGVRRDDETLTVALIAGLRASVVIMESWRWALVLVAGGGVSVGEALPGQNQSLGGGGVLRGFESDELLGRARVYAVAEQRWTAVTDLAWNFLHVAWVRELQLALFAGGGMLFETLDNRDRVLAAEVGAGLRAHFEYGGVQPAVLSVDVGIPVTERDLDVVRDGMVVRRRAPFGLHLGFDQFW